MSIGDYIVCFEEEEDGTIGWSLGRVERLTVEVGTSKMTVPRKSMIFFP